jgi:hypothetical protein
MFLSLIQYNGERELVASDFVDYVILLIGIISLLFWLSKKITSSQLPSVDKKNE